MSHKNAIILTDADNNPIPQFYNPKTGLFEPLIGEGGATLTKLTGSNLAEQLTEADAVTGTLTFSENINVIEIYNTDTANAGVFTVNGMDITVPAGEVFKAAIGGTPSPTVTVTGATTYIVSRYE